MHFSKLLGKLDEDDESFESAQHSPVNMSNGGGHVPLSQPLAASTQKSTTSALSDVSGAELNDAL